MIVVVCLPCALAVRILPNNQLETGELGSLVGKQSEFWPDRFPCPRCDRHAKGILEREADPRALAALEVKDVTPTEAFQLFNGLGFPDEQNCTLETLNEVLREQPVRKLHGMNVQGSTRSVIESIELWDGTVIHLGASPEGAIAFRCTRPTTAVERVERELPP